MEDLQEDDIMALPLSSSDEEEEARSDTTAGTKRKTEGKERMSASKKQRFSETLKPSRSSKRNLQRSQIGAEDETVSEPQQQTASIPEFPDFLSQSSQSRKQQRAKFGRSNSYVLNGSQGSGFADPGEIPSTPRKHQGASFIILDGTPKSRKRTPSGKMKQIKVPTPVSKTKEAPVAFRLPDELGLPVSSSTSTEVSNAFDADNSPKAASRKRQSSTSSLSSVDSMASYELDQQRKDALQNGIALQKPLPTGAVYCPLCLRAVHLTKASFHSDPANLSLRKQQIFCHSHRLSDARTEWKAKSYPILDWTLLEKKRIEKHIPHLRQVLYQKTPSFYLEILENKVKEAKGNQNKIRTYFATEIVEVVKPGYYGPKGAKVMGNAISTEMSHHLKRSLKTDKTVRAVGVSGFVSAVLLPELLLKLVMEDMKVNDEKEARKLIGESTEVGMLLWPDDDHVVRGIDEDDDDGEDGNGGTEVVGGVTS